MLVASTACDGALLSDPSLQLKQHNDILETRLDHGRLGGISSPSHDQSRTFRSKAAVMHPSISSEAAQEKSISSDKDDDPREDDREFLRDLRIGALARSKMHPVLLKQQRRDQVHRAVQKRLAFSADWDSVDGERVHADGHKKAHI